MKRTILISLAGAAILYSCSPTEYRVERNVTIDAPASLVFEQVNNHKNRDAWSPWEKMDPEMEKSYEGPESGVGAKYMWSGNDSVGTGSLEILESIPNEYIKSKLEFTEPWETQSTIEWTFTESEEGVTASWASSGELPGFMFWMGQEDMDEMMGADFENGLDMLKKVSEEKASMSSGAAVSEVTVEALPIYYIDGEVKISEMDSAFYAERYSKIGAYLGSDAQNMLEMPLAVALVWNYEEDKAVIRVALACESDKEGEGEIMKGMTHGGKAVRGVHMGDYENLEETHDAVSDYIEANQLEMAGPPWEVYTTDPGSEPDPSKWITNVYYPVL